MSNYDFEEKPDQYIPPEEYKEVRVDSRGYSIAVIDRMMPWLRLQPRASHWQTWDAFFGPLNTFVKTSTAAALYAQKHELIGRLLDVYLKDESKHPELNNIPLEMNGRRFQLRYQSPTNNIISFADWRDIISCLRHLICAQEFSQHTPMAKEMLANPKFFPSFFMDATTAAQARDVVAVIVHLCKSNPKFTEALLSLFWDGLATHNHEQARPYYRVIAGLIENADAFGNQDILNRVMDGFMKHCEKSQNYWKETDTNIYQMIMLAKRFKPVLAWLLANKPRWVWMLEWLKEHPTPPIGVSDAAPEFKNCRERNEHVAALHQDQWYSYTGNTLHSWYGVDVPAKQAVLEYLAKDEKEGKGLDTIENGYDSDDERQTRDIVAQGTQVDCLDSDAKWLAATVKS